MKKMKRFIAAVMALALMLALCVPAMAANLTVTGNELTGKTVTVVRMFRATWTDKDTYGNVNGQIDADEEVGYELDALWIPFFRDELGKSALALVSDEEAYNYVSSMTPSNQAAITAFAKRAKDYYEARTTYFAALDTVSSAAVNNSVTIDGLDAGYYLIIPQSGSTGTRGHDAMLYSIPSSQSNPQVNLKTTYPTITKTVEGGETTAAQIGDEVTFTLTSVVPDMTEYTTYRFGFKDTLSNGLTYVPDSLEVKVGDTKIKEDATNGYVFSQEENTLIVAFANLKNGNTLLTNDTPVAAGDTITVTYRAKLNNNAVIAGAGNNNTAIVVYSNDPSVADGSTMGQSTPDEAKTFTYSIQINKYDAVETTKMLQGAVFEVHRGEEITAIQFVVPDPTEHPNVYRVATAEEIANTGIVKYDRVTTPDTGIVIINGLDADVYHIVEVTAPTGYNKLGSPVDVTISATGGTDYSIPQYVVGTEAAKTSNVVGIENNNGSLLPFTGGAGTVIIIVVGVAVIAGCAYVLIFSKKKEQKEEK